MHANDLDPARLRRLAGLKATRGTVLSFYVDLDPTTFAAPPARQSQVSSLVDEAERRLREAELSHDTRVAAREDLGRVREALSEMVTNADGAQGAALFACGPEELFELVRLPRPIAFRFVYDDSPWIEPLVRLGREQAVCVALVDREHARILHGTRDGLVELDEEVRELERALADSLPDEPRRHARHTDTDVHEHVKRLSRLLLELQKTRGYECLLIGAPGELRGEIEEQLHPYVRDRLGGWIDVPVEYSRVDEVRRVAAEALDAERGRRDDAALERLRERLGRGERAAGGLAAVLAALNERRVETLLYDDRLRATGVVCPTCGFLGVDEAECPVDGTPTERRDDIVENAAETALLQSAEVRALHDRPDLGPHGGIAATLRF
jgi:peptide chain release factor subunit 1